MRNSKVHPPRKRPLVRIAPLALLLGGCASFQHHPPPVVAAPPPPTPAACVEPAQIPKEPPMVGQKFNGDAKHDLQVLAPNAKALRDWGQQLRTMLEACAAPAEGAPAKTPETAAAKP